MSKSNSFPIRQTLIARGYVADEGEGKGDLVQQAARKTARRKRFDKIEVMGEPKRVYSSFVKGYETLPVRVS